MYRIILILFCFFSLSNAQDISGLWVTQKLDEENLHSYNATIYIRIDDSGKVSGYVYDEEDGGWCYHTLEGRYNPKSKLLRLNTTDLIEKTEDHEGTRFTLNYKIEDGRDYFIGKLKLKGFRLLLKAVGVKVSQDIVLQRPSIDDLKSNKGYIKMRPKLTLAERNSIWRNFIKNENFSTVEADSIVRNSIYSQSEITKNPMTKESAADVFATNDKKEEIEAFTKSMADRKNELINSHNLTSRKITIEVLDNNREDGDRITIYVNDKLIAYNLEVTKSPKIIEVILPEDKNTHKVVFVANNMGEVPPNTAKIRYTVDGVFYEEILFTNLGLNKYLQFIIN